MLIHTFCKICEHQIVLQEWKSKQKQFQVHNSHKTCEYSNKLLYYFGKIEENIDMSGIHLAVQISKKGFYLFVLVASVMSHGGLGCLNFRHPRCVHREFELFSTHCTAESLHAGARTEGGGSFNVF